jgi:hypothetical protein
MQDACNHFFLLGDPLEVLSCKDLLCYDAWCSKLNYWWFVAFPKQLLAGWDLIAHIQDQPNCLHTLMDNSAYQVCHNRCPTQCDWNDFRINSLEGPSVWTASNDSTKTTTFLFSLAKVQFILIYYVVCKIMHSTEIPCSVYVYNYYW